MLTERLSKLRLDRNFTHQDMADQLGMTRQGYGHYESGKRAIDSDTLSKLADILRVDTDYLLGRTEVPKEPSEENLNIGLAFYGGPESYSAEEIKVMQAALRAYREHKEKRS
ncbi:transcriptional regulator with XRE-family HTH domain [Paenibacillus shirakamiensis]|uniref:Transcriptional regulator with XRE-family HTH domain n=1 Tax=Paenibacillus shirakamiensis TaxID=1265935 RepID=A0ABS4JDT1_9BACL|nr:transcriptional regulator with XRE-family HTH domain [Paenibacillus shirakamiensis]